MLGRLLSCVGAMPAATILACPTAFSTLKSLALQAGMQYASLCLPTHSQHGISRPLSIVLCTPLELASWHQTLP